MLDAGYEKELMMIMEQVLKAGEEMKEDFAGLSGVQELNRRSLSKRQIIMASATITANVNTAIKSLFGETNANFVKMIEDKTHMNLTNLDH